MGGGSHLSLDFFFMLQVDCSLPPSDKIGINSVQRENEEILPMKAMKMAWVPYVPLEDRYFYVIILSDICGLWFSLLTYTFCLVIRMTEFIFLTLLSLCL